jgi:hypothetical protein
MQLRYDEDFLEAAVFLCTSGRRPGVPSLQVARFHRERERLYQVLDPDARNAAFFKLHLEWFREWGLEQPLAEAMTAFPRLRSRLDALAVRGSRRPAEEGAELYVNEAGQRTGLLTLRPERLARDPALAAFLRHEFAHLDDMLNPDFGYSPQLDLPGLNAAQQRLARERYRLLWDITIDGRLAASGVPPMRSRAQHAQAFAGSYPFWPADQQSTVFDSLWSNASPRHAELLTLIADPRGLRDARRPAPGAACPLCAFSTFDWAEVGSLSPGLVSRIAAEFPSWSPEQGLCDHCRESYEVAGHLGPIEAMRKPSP